MGIKVDVLPLSENTPGQGWLRISGWTGASEGLEYSLQSSQSRDFLHPGKQWSNVAHWFELSLVPAEGADALQAHIGPELIDPLLAASGSANFRITLNNPGQGQSEASMVRLDKQLLTSIALTGVKAPEPAPPAAPQTVQLPEPAPVIEAPAQAAQAPATPDPAPAPVVEPATAPAKKNRWLLPLLLIVLLALGAGIWWFMQQPKPAVVEKPAVPTTDQPTPTVQTQPCTLESMQSQDQLAFVQSCLQKAPDSASLLEVINVAKANKHCEVAQRLYANRAQNGDILIATAYAHEYDPKFHQASECFKEPQVATAAYWYETILGFDPTNADAKQRFEELNP